MKITQYQRDLFNQIGGLGAALLTSLAPTDDEIKQAEIDLQDEDIIDFMDDDVFKATYIYFQRDSGNYEADDGVKANEG